MASSTVAPSTTRLPTSGPTTASVAYVNGRMGAVFGEEVAFRLYAFDATSLRGYVDTTTGQLVNASSPVPGDEVFTGSETRLFVFNSRTQLLSTIDRNLREPAMTIARDVSWAFPSASGRLWAVVGTSGSTDSSRLVESPPMGR